MFKIINAPVRGYAEEGQDHDVKFSFVNLKGDTITELFTPIKCRDFLGDALFAEQIKKPVSIYNFVFDPKTQKIDRDKTRMLVSTQKSEIKYLDQIEKNIAILHTVESMHNLELTTMQRVNETNILVEADPKWLLTTYLISYYTYLIKIASYSYRDKYKDWKTELMKENTKEVKYLVQTTTFLDKFEKNLFNICEPYKGVAGMPDETTIGIIHHNTGFVCTSTGSAKSTYATNFKSM